MSYTLGLWIGESFAELRSRHAEVQSCWYLPRRSLRDGLHDSLRQLIQQSGADAVAGSTIHIASQRAELTLKRRQGHLPALLVTSGFESWITQSQPLDSAPFAWRASRAWLPAKDDLIFGIHERTAADGTIQEPLQIQELEFLVAKLELLNVKDIAIGFLHSNCNPESELQAERFFRERGFRVVSSHQMPQLNGLNELNQSTQVNELERWKWALEKAYVSAAVEEEKAEVTAALGALLKDADGDAEADGEADVESKADAGAAMNFSVNWIDGGPMSSLSNYARSKSAPPILYFGLEGFYLVTEERGASALPVQPTQQIEFSPAWPVPTLISEDRGYVPGPMLLGRSRIITPLDVLFARENLQAPDPIASLIVDKTRPRILETLLTMGRMIPEAQTKSLDGIEVAEDLEMTFAERILGAMAIGRVSLQKESSKREGPIHICGPLAQTFLSLLKDYRPDLEFVLREDFAWTLADSCMESGTGQ